MTSVRSALPTTCQVHVPEANSNPLEVISRWSDTLVSLPRAIVTPSNVEDIIATIDYAIENKLKIVPAGGGHGSFLPITHDTIYLDMKNFNSFEIDEDKGEVRFGGGCITGPLMKGLAQKGYYTAVPNSNAVGMTGAILGGLNHPLGGVRGMGSDMVRSLTVIPFRLSDGKKVEPITLTKESTGEDKRLFNALRGAGHGLALVISTTMEAYPVGNLNLDEGDKIWQRSLVFSPDNLPAAVATYLALRSNVPPEMSFFLGFMRAPPAAPHPGAPVIILSISFFGSASAAEKAAAITYNPDTLAKTVNATTKMTSYGDINDALDPFNKHGGFKEIHGAFLHSITASSLTRAFDSFVQFTNDKPSRFGTAVLFPTISTTKSQSLAPNSLGVIDFYNTRDRGIYVSVRTSYTEASDKGEADAFAIELHDIAREEDARAGMRKWMSANNLTEGMSMELVYTQDQIQEICSVNSHWNPEKVGWCPVAEGWRRLEQKEGRKASDFVSTVETVEE